MEHSARGPSFDLTGSTALVTGASGGIGRAVARAYAAAGADLVLLSDVDQSDVAGEVEALGRQSHCVVLDLAERTGRTEAIAAVLDQYDIDILVNNAGRIARSPAAEMDGDAWYGVVELNLHAAFELAREAGRRMLQRGSGRIVNTGSLLSFQGGSHAASYAASKHALAGLTRALANEWAGRGVNVNAIAPGYVDTALAAALRDDPEQNAYISSRIPAGRWATPDDIAGPAVFLASPAARYVHGHVLVVDGGWLSR